MLIKGSSRAAQAGPVSHGPDSVGERFETMCAVFEVKARTRAGPPQLNSSHLSMTFFFFLITVFYRRLLLRKGFPYK